VRPRGAAPAPEVHVWARAGADRWTLLRPLDQPGEPVTANREQLAALRARRPGDVWVIDGWHLEP
jgi:hypothetical protein